MAKRGRKPQPPLTVEDSRTYVPLPDEAAFERWCEGWRLLLELEERLDSQEVHAPAERQGVSVETVETEGL